MQQFFMTAAAPAVEGGTMAMVMQFLPFVLIIAVFYFLMIRPQKKKEKQVQEMRSRIEVGDEIITIGGIIGTVVIAKEEYIVLETGSDRSKVRIARWAIQTNNTPKEAVPVKAEPASPEVEK